MAHPKAITSGKTPVAFDAGKLGTLPSEERSTVVKQMLYSCGEIIIKALLNIDRYVYYLFILNFKERRAGLVQW